jgi:predicted Zn-dependent protease
MIFRRRLRLVSLAIVAFCLAASLRATPAPASDDNQKVIEVFRAAQQDMQAGRIESAIQGFKKVLQLEPGLVEARANLGLAYNAAGYYEQAATELSAAAKQRPDLLPASLFLGISYLKLGSPEKAIAPLNHALALDASNQDARSALASAELSEENYGKASEQFRWLFAAQSDKADAWYKLGHNYLQMVKRLTTTLSVRFPDSAWSRRLAGDILVERRAWNEAAFAYGKAIQAQAAQPGLHADLGKALLRAGKTAEAESEFNNELSRDPYESQALLGTAQVQLLEGNAQSALEAVSKVWQTSPEILAQVSDFPSIAPSTDAARQIAAALEKGSSNPPREFLLSALLRILGDSAASDEARANFEKSAQAPVRSTPERDLLSRSACERHQERACAELLALQKPITSSDLLRLGQALFVLNRHEAASNAFATAVSQNKESAQALYWLDRAYLRLADECFDQLTAAYPDSWRAHELKGESFSIRQADQEAIAEFRVAARMHPADAEIHEMLGEDLLRQKRPAEAKPELETALQLNPSAPRSLYLLGELYVDEREPAKGIPYLESALRYDPSLLEARPVLGRAYLKAGKPELAAPQLEQASRADRYGDLHYLLYEAYRDEGKQQLAAAALARSQELRRKSAADDQAKIRPLDEE